MLGAGSASPVTGEADALAAAAIATAVDSVSTIAAAASPEGGGTAGWRAHALPGLPPDQPDERAGAALAATIREERRRVLRPKDLKKQRPRVGAALRVAGCPAGVGAPGWVCWASFGWQGTWVASAAVADERVHR